MSIAAESELDGKAAVQSGLRELARLGYYRIERRRLLDGRLMTGTAVSEEPLASWAAEYAEYQGPVPVIQQPDGSFQVKRKNGSLSGDGFTIGPSPQPRAAVSDGRVPAGHTGTRFPGAGSPGAARTGAGSADAGEPGAPINTEQPLQTTSPPCPSPDHRGPLPWPTSSPGRRTRIWGRRRDWTHSSRRSAKSAPNGRQDRSAVPWPTQRSPSAAGTGHAGRCSLWPPIPGRTSPAGSRTMGPGGNRLHPARQRAHGRRGAAIAATRSAGRSRWTASQVAARPATRSRRRLHGRRQRREDPQLPLQHHPDVAAIQHDNDLCVRPKSGPRRGSAATAGRCRTGRR